MEQYWQELQQQVHRKAALERKQDALCEQRRKLKEELGRCYTALAGRTKRCG